MDPGVGIAGDARQGGGAIAMVDQRQPRRQARSDDRERIGGIRVGYDLGAIQAAQEGAIGDLRGRLADLGRRNLAWLVSFGFALLVLGGAWALASYLSGRVSRLVAQANTLGRGELGAFGETAINAIDGTLAKYLNLGEVNSGFIVTPSTPCAANSRAAASRRAWAWR